MSKNVNFFVGAAAGIATVVFLPKIARCFAKKAAALKAKQAAKRFAEVEVQRFSVEDLTNEFPALRERFLEYSKTAYGIPDHAIERVRKMIDYNCVGGKLQRGLIVLETTKTFCVAKGLDFETVKKQAVVLAWAIEILQAYFLVADDMMDKSELRRGQPCWYRLPEVQNDAINDAFILCSFLYYLLRSEFEHDVVMKSRILDLFQEVSLNTEYGQLLDLLSQPQGRKGKDVLDNFSLDLQTQIVTNKTAIYTFYLSIACGMILTGYTDSADFAKAKAIAVELGIKFQIQDDYLDCFGDREAIGKDGTDIQDHKCTWLLVQALLKIKEANDEKSMKIIEDNLGKWEPESVAAIKTLYNELGLHAVYDEQEERSKAKINTMIDASADVFPPSVFRYLLDRIHKRQK